MDSVLLVAPRDLSSDDFSGLQPELVRQRSWPLVFEDGEARVYVRKPDDRGVADWSRAHPSGHIDRLPGDRHVFEVEYRTRALLRVVLSALGPKEEFAVWDDDGGEQSLEAFLAR